MRVEKRNDITGAGYLHVLLGNEAEDMSPPIARAIARKMIEIANQIDRENEDPDSLLGTP